MLTAFRSFGLVLLFTERFALLSDIRLISLGVTLRVSASLCVSIGFYSIWSGQIVSMKT